MQLSSKLKNCFFVLFRSLRIGQHFRKSDNQWQCCSWYLKTTSTRVSESICSFYIHGDLFSLYFKTSNVNKKCIFALPTNKVINVPTLLTFSPMKHSRLNEHFTKKHSDKVGNDISYLLVFSLSINL